MWKKNGKRNERKKNRKEKEKQTALKWNSKQKQYWLTVKGISYATAMPCGYINLNGIILSWHIALSNNRLCEDTHYILHIIDARQVQLFISRVQLNLLIKGANTSSMIPPRFICTISCGCCCCLCCLVLLPFLQFCFIFHFVLLPSTDIQFTGVRCGLNWNAIDSVCMKTFTTIISNILHWY